MSEGNESDGEYRQKNSYDEVVGVGVGIGVGMEGDMIQRNSKKKENVKKNNKKSTKNNNNNNNNNNNKNNSNNNKHIGQSEIMYDSQGQRSEMETGEQENNNEEEEQQQQQQYNEDEEEEDKEEEDDDDDDDDDEDDEEEETNRLKKVFEASLMQALLNSEEWIAKMTEKRMSRKKKSLGSRTDKKSKQERQKEVAHEAAQDALIHYFYQMSSHAPRVAIQTRRRGYTEDDWQETFEDVSENVDTDSDEEQELQTGQRHSQFREQMQRRMTASALKKVVSQEEASMYPSIGYMQYLPYESLTMTEFPPIVAKTKEEMAKWRHGPFHNSNSHSTSGKKLNRNNKKKKIKKRNKLNNSNNKKKKKKPMTKKQKQNKNNNKDKHLLSTNKYTNSKGKNTSNKNDTEKKISDTKRNNKVYALRKRGSIDHVSSEESEEADNIREREEPIMEGSDESNEDNEGEHEYGEENKNTNENEDEEEKEDDEEEEDEEEEEEDEDEEDEDNDEEDEDEEDDKEEDEEDNITYSLPTEKFKEGLRRRLSSPSNTTQNSKLNNNTLNSNNNNNNNNNNINKNTTESPITVIEYRSEDRERLTSLNHFTPNATVNLTLNLNGNMFENNKRRGSQERILENEKLESPSAKLSKTRKTTQSLSPRDEEESLSLHTPKGTSMGQQLPSFMARTSHTRALESMGSIPPETQPRLGKRNAESNVQLYADDIHDVVGLRTPSPMNISISPRSALAHEPDQELEQEQDQQEQEQHDQEQEQEQEQEQDQDLQPQSSSPQLPTDNKILEQYSHDHQHPSIPEQHTAAVDIQPQANNNTHIRVYIPIEPFESPRAGPMAPRNDSRVRLKTDVAHESRGSESSLSSKGMTPRSNNNSAYGWGQLANTPSLDLNQADALRVNSETNNFSGLKRDTFIGGIPDIHKPLNGTNHNPPNTIIGDVNYDSISQHDLETQLSELRQELQQKSAEIERLNKALEDCTTSKIQLAVHTGQQIVKLNKIIHILLALPAEKFADRESIVRKHLSEP